jgi:hypothetical protein
MLTVPSHRRSLLSRPALSGAWLGAFIALSLARAVAIDVCSRPAFTVRSRGDFGAALANVRDIDGDGVDDYAAGAPGDPGEAGAVHLISGHAASGLFSIAEEGAPGGFGHSLLSYGRQPGERDLLAVGAPCAASSRGRVIVFEVSAAGAAELFRVTGDEPGELLGFSLGVVQHGNELWLLVGAPGSNKGQPGAGRVLLVDSTGAVRFVMVGQKASEGFGVAVAGAGDVDADGESDIVAGSIELREGGSTRGHVTVRHQDGMVLATLNGAIDEQLGGVVARAGDLDGDGFDDFVAGASGHRPRAPCDDSPSTETDAVGKVYVFRGGRKPQEAGGILGTQLRVIADDRPGTHFGSSLAVVPDMDGDAIREIAVGSPLAPFEKRPRAGRVDVFAGADGRLLRSFGGARAGDHLGSSLDGIGDQDLDAVADLLVGRHRKEGEVSVFSLADADGNEVRDVCEPCAAPLDLVAGPPVQVALTRLSRRRCFRFDLPKGAAFRIQFSFATGNAPALFLLRWGAPPDPDTYDQSYSGLLSALPPLVVPFAPGVPGYLVMQAGRLDTEDLEIGLRLELLEGTTVLDMTPARAVAGPTLGLFAALRGVRFPEGVTFSLRPRAGGADLPALETIRISAERADARFQLGAARPGTYDVVALVKATQVGVLGGAFELAAASGGEGRRVSLIGPNVYRNNSVSRLTLRFENLGSAPIRPPLYRIVGPPGTQFGFARDADGFSEQILGLGRSVLTPDGSLPAGRKLEVPIWFRKALSAEDCSPQGGDCRLAFEVQVFEPYPAQPIRWDSVRAPKGMEASVWAKAKVELERSITTWAGYYESLVDVAGLLARRGRFIHSALPAFELGIRHVLDLPSAALTGTLRQRGNGAPIAGASIVATQGGAPRSYARTNAEGYFVLDWLEHGSRYTLEVAHSSTGDVVDSDSPEVLVPEVGDRYGIELLASEVLTGAHLDLICPPCEQASLPAEALMPPAPRFVKRSSFSTRLITSFDPNEKNGSGSQGGDVDIDPSESIEYQIYFENLGSAAARRVEIEDFLPLELDWTTVELLDVVVDAAPEQILVSLGSDEGSGAPGAEQDYSSGSGLPIEPSQASASGGTSSARAHWSGAVHYVDGDDSRSADIALTIIATAEPSGEATLYGPEQVVVSWSLTGIVEDTPPPGGVPADAGFLPYGCEEGSEAPSCGGHVSFTVAPAPGTDEDTIITNDAEITFDGGDTVVTDPPAVVTVRTMSAEPFGPNPTSDPGSSTRVAANEVVLAWEAHYAARYDLFLWDSVEGATRPSSQDRARVWELDLLAAGFPVDGSALELTAGREWRWQVVAKDARGAPTEGPVWSFSTGVEFRRGDADGSGILQITDAIRTLTYLFLGGDAPGCLDALDADDSGVLNITDPILILGYLFIGNGEIPPPGALLCGPDPTPDGVAAPVSGDLGCASYGACP